MLFSCHSALQHLMRRRVADQLGDNEHHEDDTTHAVARLPGLDITVMHRRSSDAEQISIHLQAMPSFEAFGRFLGTTNPFAFWAQAAQLAWSPWLALFPWLNTTRVLQDPAIT